MTINTPIVMFGFNRADKLEGLLQRITQDPFSKAYIFCDGARNDADAAACQATQTIAQQYADKYPIELVIRPQNIGLNKNIINGIDTVLSAHPQAMIFEDDVYPRPGCLEYLDLALKVYQDHPEIFSIGCFHRKTDLNGYRESTLLSPRFNCWGWATWATRWQPIREALVEGLVPFSHYYQVPEIAGADLPSYVKQHRLKGLILTWDTLSALLYLKNGWLQVQPREVLVENMGFDGSGTHCGNSAHSPDSFVEDYNIADYKTLNPSITLRPDVVKALAQSYQKSSGFLHQLKMMKKRLSYHLHLALRNGS